MSSQILVPLCRIERRILFLRGEKVLIDADLAEFYQVSTKRLNEQVRRNKERFPEDFMFRLNPEEKSELVANCDRFNNLKHSNVLPCAFTEHGAIMAASVLRSSRAVQVSVFVVRAFVRLRRAVGEHKGLSRRLEQLERHLAGHDRQILSLAKAMRQALTPSTPSKRKIGFVADDDNHKE
jgi:hypothetical protein